MTQSLILTKEIAADTDIDDLTTISKAIRSSPCIAELHTNRQAKITVSKSSTVIHLNFMGIVTATNYSLNELEQIVPWYKMVSLYQ